MIATQAFAGALAFGITVALVPVVIALSKHWRLFDAPGPLKIHTQPIPRLGGIAIAFAICAAAFFSGPQRATHAWPFFAAIALVWAAGLADDLRGISPWVRLAAQFSAGALLWRYGWRLPVFGEGALNFTGTVFYVAGFANAVNLLDGMDGLAAGVVGIISVAYLILPGGFISPFALAVAWSLFGACVGFLFFNFPSFAQLYMGDAGSNLLGLCLAFLGLDLYRSHAPTPPTLLFPLLAAALPLLDAALAVIRRLRIRSSIFTGDRKHSYDLLSDLGWPARRIVLAFYGVTATLAAIGLFGVRSESPPFWAVAVISAALLMFVTIRLGALQTGERDSPMRHRSAEVTEAEYAEPSQTD